MVRYYHALWLLAVLFSCQNVSSHGVKDDEDANKPELIEVAAIQELIDSLKLKGAVLIYDMTRNKYYSNDFKWSQKGQLPASTFKIPHSIIALETRVIKSEFDTLQWDGEPRYLPVWEQDLLFKEAFRYSCVPCYQSIAGRIGVERMKSHLTNLDFGEMKVDSSNLQEFWLVGESRINQFQQINFLNKLINSQLEISKRTENIVKEIMILEKNDDYVLSGKTGWSNDGKDNGWFIGFVESSNRKLIFATNIEPLKGFDMDHFSNVRRELTISALEIISAN